MNSDNGSVRRGRQPPIVNMRPGGRGGSGGGSGGGPMGARMSAEKPKNFFKTLTRLLKYIGKSRKSLILLLTVMIASTALTLAGPYLQGKAINAVTLTEGHLTVDFDSLWVILAVMAGIYALNSLVTYFQGRLSAKLSQQTVCTLREDLFRKLARLPIRYTDTHRHGDIMSRMTNDVETISDTVAQSIASFISSILTIIGSLVMLLYISPIMTLISMITIPLTILVSNLLAKFMKKYYVEQQKLLGALNGQVEEMVVGYKTVMAFGREDAAKKEFADVSRRLCRVGIRARIWGGVVGPAMNVLNNLNYLLIAAFGGYFALRGTLLVGDIQSIIQYSKQFTRPINEIANLYAQILTAIAGAERVFEIMDEPDEADGGKHDIDASSVRGSIEFRNVCFSYIPGEQVLKDLNISVTPGQKIAIVGATGSGKTTIVNLLTRFYDADSGEILLDGVPINDIPKKELRSAVAIVLQDTVLFSDTIAANIKYGNRGASDEHMREAAKTANADVFIERLPEEYETKLAESGGNLSQGQRQLISIARAVMADPKILILDEATSSIDTRTEMNIQSAMVALMKNRTSLIIAHRLSTIRDADRIVVISGGHVAESGSHDELIAARGEYYKLYQNQFAGIET